MSPKNISKIGVEHSAAMQQLFRLQIVMFQRPGKAER